MRLRTSWRSGPRPPPTPAGPWQCAQPCCAKSSAPRCFGLEPADTVDSGWVMERPTRAQPTAAQMIVEYKNARMKLLFQGRRVRRALSRLRGCGRHRNCWLRLIRAMLVEIVDVPRDAFLSDFTMLAEVFESVGAGRGVVLLVGEVRCFDGCLVLQAKSAVDDGQVVMGGQIVGIDGL